MGQDNKCRCSQASSPDSPCQEPPRRKPQWVYLGRGRYRAVYDNSPSPAPDKKSEKFGLNLAGKLFMKGGFELEHIPHDGMPGTPKTFTSQKQLREHCKKFHVESQALL